MTGTVFALRALIDWLWPLAAILGGLTGVAYLFAVRAPLPNTRKTPARLAFLGLAALLATTVALGSGSCFVGGTMAGLGICPFTPRGAQRQLDPVADFALMQMIYLVVCVLCIATAALIFLHVLPGNRTGWEQLLFVVSLGTKGNWS